MGALVQGGSILTESLRLCLIQILLHNRGVKLNPITTLYYIAPACFVFLLVPFCVMELPTLMAGNQVVVVVPLPRGLLPGLLLVSAATAFGKCHMLGYAYCVVGRVLYHVMRHGEGATLDFGAVRC